MLELSVFNSRLPRGFRVSCRHVLHAFAETKRTRISPKIHENVAIMVVSAFQEEMSLLGRPGKEVRARVAGFSQSFERTFKLL